jgi:hypothetical protein
MSNQQLYEKEIMSAAAGKIVNYASERDLARRAESCKMRTAKR